jgi:hypothetical protein
MASSQYLKKWRKKENLTRRECFSLMEHIKHRIVNTPLYKNEVSSIIGEHLAQTLKVNVVQAEAKEVDIGDMNINAFYDPDDDMMGKACIELILVYSPYENILIFDEEGWINIVRRIADSVAHEQRHKYQYRQRDWESWGDDDSDDEIETARIYLGNKDEIDAYSINIANELLDNFTFSETMSHLSNPKKIEMSKSVNLWAYMTVFGMDFTHPVLKRLLKKVYKILPDQVRTKD